MDTWVCRQCDQKDILNFLNCELKQKLIYKNHSIPFTDIWLYTLVSYKDILLGLRWKEKTLTIVRLESMSTELICSCGLRTHQGNKTELSRFNPFFTAISFYHQYLHNNTRFNKFELCLRFTEDPSLRHRENAVKQWIQKRLPDVKVEQRDDLEWLVMKQEAIDQ